MIPELLKTKVWAGISAGSMVTSPTLVLSSKDDNSAIMVMDGNVEIVSEGEYVIFNHR